ncbi:hypothetical protein RRG08_042978 [Elysia crispata]|uniref:Uncharacterized protein n=1 Tax=Elysia crispata TaxID=231223 RepID=A0AAE1AZ95_9GAST|nr:hypothetical protein RRG08_042978 [Elysia crispata]
MRGRDFGAQVDRPLQSPTIQQHTERQQANSKRNLLHHAKMCDEWNVSADLTEWDSHPSIVKETRLRPDNMISSSFTKQLIMAELTITYENRIEEVHIYKREKNLNLTKELGDAG